MDIVVGVQVLIEHDWPATTGYCMKDKDMPHYECDAHNMSPEYLEHCWQKYSRMKLTHEQGKELVTPNTFFKKVYGYKRLHVGDDVPMTAERVAWFMFSDGTHMISQNFIISNGQAFKPERFKAMERIIWAPETLGMEDITSLLFYKKC